MALRITEFFGYIPLDAAAGSYVAAGDCPFVLRKCIKPRHGACSVQQITAVEPVICCPNRLYGTSFKILQEIADDAFGLPAALLRPEVAKERLATGSMVGDEVAVFGRYWGQELPLPTPPGRADRSTRKYYVDWMLAKLDANGGVEDMTAVEVQTIDTTGNYGDQSEAFFSGKPFVDRRGRNPGYSDAGMNWENVNKRILPQLIYKGHVLRREAKCSKGLFFVCPKQVYDRVRERLGGTLHAYQPGPGTITFRSYELGSAVPLGQQRTMTLFGQFTTTIDQVALAFTSPMNLPDQNVYEAAISAALQR